MKKRHLIVHFIIAALFLAVVSQRSVTAAPVLQETNLLNNASFEQPYVNGAADSWSTWHMETEKTDSECLSGYHFEPKWNMETNGTYVNDGIASQYIGNNWDTWGGGVFQTVDVTPGNVYRFTFFAKGRTANEPSPAASEPGIKMNVRAGIDPNGSGQWSDADVVWGASGSPHDNWQQFSVETTALGDKITVFTAADLGVVGTNQCREFLDTWYDKAELLLVGASSSPAEPSATAVPGTTPVPQPTTSSESPTDGQTQPTAEPDAVAEAPSAPSAAETTICVNAFNDVNANGLHDPNEAFMPGVTFTVASPSAIIGSVISDGSETPKCYYFLDPGRYQVAQQVPADLIMTSAANVAVEASGGTTVAVDFGSRVRGAPVTEPLPGDAAPETGDNTSAAGDVDSGGQTEPASGAMICVNAFHDENANALIDPNEGYMAGVTLTVASGTDVVGQVVSPGSETPHCIGSLTPGAYEVTQQLSGRLEATTAGSAIVSVADGQIMQVEFGSRLQMGDAGTVDSGEGDTGAQSDEGADEGGPDLLAIGGLAVVVLGVILLGALIFFLLRR